jgi:hypothetical protein
MRRRHDQYRLRSRNDTGIVLELRVEASRVSEEGYRG